MAKDARQNFKRTPGGRGANDKQKPHTRRGDKEFYKPPRTTNSPRFKGNSHDLEGYIFDCSDNKQADRFIHTLKRIAEYVGTEYCNGGDISSTIKQSVWFAIPKPLAPSGTTDEVEKMILTKKVDAYVKRDSILDKNIQKAYSLMLEHCTELLKSKMKMTTDWMTVSTDFDLLGHIKTIRTVIFKFEDQRYLPLSLHHAKSNFY